MKNNCTAKQIFFRIAVFAEHLSVNASVEYLLCKFSITFFLYKIIPLVQNSKINHLIADRSSLMGHAFSVLLLTRINPRKTGEKHFLVSLFIWFVLKLHTSDI